MLAWWIWLPLGVMATEMIVTNERPGWLAWLCRVPLAAAHRVRSPEKAEGAEASDYRAPAGHHVAPWRRLGLTLIPAAVVHPVPGTDTFVVQPTGWRRLFLARIDLSQEGEDVVMDARFVPSPITLVPAVIVIVGAVMLHRGVASNLLGGGIGTLVGLAFAFGRARTAAKEATQLAMEELGEALRSEVRPTIARPTPWRGRVSVAALAGLLALRMATAATDEDREVAAIARQYELTPDQARRVAASLGALEGRMDDPRLVDRDLEAVVRAGLGRLDDDELLEHQSIESRLTRQSDELCAGLATGRASQADVLRALAMQDESIVRAWFRHMDHAIVHELDGTGAVMPADPEAYASDAIDRALGTLPEEEAEALRRRMATAASEDPRESCDGYRATEAVLSLMAPTEQASVLRALHAMATPADPT